jgi:hypothetical protein
MPGDIIEIERPSGKVSFIRKGERIHLNVHPLDADRPRDTLECASVFTVGQAINVAKIIGIAARCKIEGVMEDGVWSRFRLIDPHPPEMLPDTPM